MDPHDRDGRPGPAARALLWLILASAVITIGIAIYGVAGVPSAPRGSAGPLTQGAGVIPLPTR